MDFHEDIRIRLKNIRESLQREKSTMPIDDKEKVKDNGKRRKKKKNRK
jgi:hypothetical protein